MRRLSGIIIGSVFAVVALIAVALVIRPVYAVDAGEFSVQVYPSPLVTTVKPGAANTVELHVHNSGSSAEDLKIEPRAFKIDNNSQELQLSDNQLPDIASWIAFSSPRFTVQPGQTATQKITLTVPKEAGFSYSFAMVISRANGTQQSSGRTLKASVAVFALINVDRPGAVRSLEVTNFSASRSSYEYLPVEFNITFKNTGNTIVQPSGDIFIQRGDADKTPIETLPVNQAGGYILPGATRTITARWTNGYPSVETKQQPDGSQKDELNWDLSRLTNMRFGKYTAKLVAIYDDGHRDVPMQATTTFWVIPWLMLLGALFVVLTLIAGVWSLVSKLLHATKRIGRKGLRR